jgi:hypothetical protein
MDQASRVRRDAAVLLIATAVVLVPIAWWSFGLGTVEQRYSLAGWAGAYAMVPEWTIGVGVFISLLLAGVMLLVHRRRRSARTQGRLRWRWWFILVAAWAGYFSGAVVGVAGGGPVAQPGTLRLDFGAPIGETAQVEATCRSVVGEVGTLAEIRSPDIEISLRYLPLGGPAYDPPNLSMTMHPANSALVPQRLRERPAITNEWFDSSGRVAGRGELSFYEAYSMTAVGHSESATDWSGNERFHMRRLDLQDTSFERYANVTVANDPWPQEFDLTVSWTCGGQATPSA